MVRLAPAEPGRGEGLAGEAAGEEVDAPVPRPVEVPDLGVDGDAGTVPREHGAAEAVGLDERDGAEAGRLGGEVETPDAAEEGEVREGWRGVNGGGLGMRSVEAYAPAVLRRDSRPFAARSSRTQYRSTPAHRHEMMARPRSGRGTRTMDTNEQDQDQPTDQPNHDEADAQENPALGPFILAVGECAELLTRIKERVDDHLGVAPDAVNWGHVADADRLLYHLRHAAFVAGAGGEPLA